MPQFGSHQISAVAVAVAVNEIRHLASGIRKAEASAEMGTPCGFGHWFWFWDMPIGDFHRNSPPFRGYCSAPLNARGDKYASNALHLEIEQKSPSLPICCQVILSTCSPAKWSAESSAEMPPPG